MIEDIKTWRVLPRNEKQLFRCPHADECEAIGRDCTDHMHPHQWIEDECTMTCETLEGDIIYDNCQPYNDPTHNILIQDEDLLI